MTEITTTLRQELHRAQVIPFARFMEIALHCPNFGYYEQDQGPVGASGDFITSVSVGPVFGQLLARQFCQWTERVANTQPLQLVEIGANDGRLAQDILGWLRQHRPDRYQRLQYVIVEPSPRRQSWQRARLDIFAGQVRWVDSLPGLGPRSVQGIIFSNELLDAFPVHRLAWNRAARAWQEYGVAWEQEHDRFVWRVLSEPTRNWDAELAQAGLSLPDELLAVLPDGFILDLSVAAREWWQTAARSLRNGWLLTIDYGLTADEFLVPQRSTGTLRAYQRHHLAQDLLANPGEQDLTAHINFSQLQKAGESEGLKTVALESQSRFLTRIAESAWKETEKPSPTEARQFQTLIHPDHFGRAFRVLVQRRETEEALAD